MIDADEFELIVERLLEEGVPPSVVGRALHLDQTLLKEAQSKVRVRRYGTDDLNEFIEQMNWQAIEEAMRMVQEGTPAEKTRVMTIIFGKQMSNMRDRTPEGQRQAQEKVQDMLEAMRSSAGAPQRERSKFVATSR